MRARRLIPLLGFGLLLRPLSAQIPRNPEEARALRHQYGQPVPVELEQIALNGETYQQRNVVTKGVLGPLVGGYGQYWALGDGTLQVLLVPAQGLGARDIDTLLGRSVEVTGVVRQLKSCQAQPPCPLGHCTLCEDPELPALPDPRTDWPRFSITVLSISDIGPSGEAPRQESESSLEDVAADPDSAAARTIRVVGQFRGRNLFGDLPKGSQRNPSDWVLKSGGHAVWVTGKQPKGKGWALDPDLASDARRWLEVVGRAEVVNGIVYLKAKTVTLTASRGTAQADAPR
jgi:hypothetical protein